MLKIKELEHGMIIWDNKCNILGITGETLEDKYYEYNCIKIEGNPFDYMLVEKVGGTNE